MKLINQSVPSMEGYQNLRWTMRPGSEKQALVSSLLALRAWIGQFRGKIDPFLGSCHIQLLQSNLF